MQQRMTLSLSDAMIAIRACLTASAEMPGRPVAVAVVDHCGEYVAFVCEADVNAALARQNAFKKAYTAACMRVDTLAFGQRLSSQGASVAAMGNPSLTEGGGGLVIALGDGTVVGGLGVSGRPSGADDEAIAQAGLRALKALTS